MLHATSLWKHGRNEVGAEAIASESPAVSQICRRSCSVVAMWGISAHHFSKSCTCSGLHQRPDQQCHQHPGPHAGRPQDTASPLSGGHNLRGGAGRTFHHGGSRMATLLACLPAATTRNICHAAHAHYFEAYAYFMQEMDSGEHSPRPANHRREDEDSRSLSVCSVGTTHTPRVRVYAM